MARRTGKKARKSGKTDPDSSSDAAPPPTEKPVPRKADNSCQFCGKPMKDSKTLKLHERSCGSKASPKKDEKDLESKVIELRDRFDEERDTLFKTFQEREDHLQRELDEVKTVLRLEMDRHRRELERISRVEREVAAKQEPPQAQAPEATAPEAIAPVEKEPPAKPRDSRPRAIDMIPMHIPTLPKKRPVPASDMEAIPDLDEEPAPPGLDRSAVEALVHDILSRKAPDAPRDDGSEELSRRLATLSERLDMMDSTLTRSVSDMGRQSDRNGKAPDLKRFEKELDKISERVLDMMEDSGYGESLSVSKIPPTILEIVYQAILDDVHMEIIRAKGAQDAERIARSALEEVRLKTSGSELFKFDGRKIVTDSLAKSIEANLISARQIQTTYDVLMERLLETVPHHKAKNFKGMIKVKSQEFAVDRATKLTKEAVRLEKQLESLNHMLAAMSANMNSQHLDLHQRLNRLEDTDLKAKADAGEVDALRTKLEETDGRCSRLADELSLLRAEMEMKSTISEREESVSGDMFLAPGQEPSESEVPEGGIFSAQGLPAQAPAQEGADVAAAVLNAVSRGMDSRAAIERDTGLGREDVERALSELTSDRRVLEKRSGKRARYSTLKLEMDKARDSSSTPGVIVLDDAEPEAPTPGVIVLDDSQEEPAPEPEKARTAGPKKPRKGKKRKEAAPEPDVAEAPAEMTAEVPVELTPQAPAETERKPPKKKKAAKSKAPAVEASGKAADETEAPLSKEAVKPPEPEKVPEPEAPAREEPPSIVKKLEELTQGEAMVLEAITEKGVTLSGIQSGVSRHMKRFELLRALRMLIDSGHVGIVAKGRMELYQRINVQQMEKTEEEKNKKEVK